jgi:proteasome accessory factor B
MGRPLEEPLRAVVDRMLDPDRQQRICQEVDSVVSFRLLAAEPAKADTFETLQTSIMERRVLMFQYRKPGEEESDTRTVHPYHLLCADNRWYILGHDVDRGEVRMFALSRLSEPRFTGQFFRMREDFDPERHLSGS